MTRLLSLLVFLTAFSVFTQARPDSGQGTWICVQPIDPNVRLLTNIIWSRAASEIPTQLVQHLWVEFPSEVAVYGIRIEPQKGYPQGSHDQTNRPRLVLIQTSRDGGLTFEIVARLDLADWKTAGPGQWNFKPAKTDNIRIVIPKADKMTFPAYTNAARIELLYSGKLEPAAAAVEEARPVQAGTVQTNPAMPGYRVELAETPSEFTYKTPVMRAAFSRILPQASFLGWDLFNNTHFEEQSLLCKAYPAGAMPIISSLRGSGSGFSDTFTIGSGSTDPASRDGALRSGRGGIIAVADNRISYRDVAVGDNVRCDLAWTVFEDRLDFEVNWKCRGHEIVPQVAALRIPFDMYAAVTNVMAMPNFTGPLGLIDLPAVINAPDRGCMELRQIRGERAYACVHSLRNRGEVWLDLMVGVRPLESGIYELLPGEHRAKFSMTLKTIFPYCNTDYGAFVRKPVLSVPEADPFRSGFIRGWINGLAFRPDIGVFANNSVSDAALCCQGWYGEHVLYTPKLADGLEMSDMLRCTLEQIYNGATFWGMDPNFFGLNLPAVCNATWCYVAKTQDWNWAWQNKKHIISYAGRFGAALDPNDGFLHEHRDGGVNGGAAWWDAVGSGNIDGHDAAMEYQALTRIAGLLDRLDERVLAAQLRAGAARMKAHYRLALYDPNTGWIAGWRGRDGRLHDYGNLAYTGAAISVGLIEPNDGAPMLQKLLTALRQSGFESYQYGLPTNIFPVRREDFCFGYGSPLDPDGNDVRQVYMNGSATGGQAYWFIQALYVCGMRNEANTIFRKICEGYYKALMCGPLNSGVDWRGWDGRPAGYEGLLVDMYHPLQAFLTGYLGWEYTLDGLKTRPDSAATFLLEVRKCVPDFGPLAPR